MKIAIENLHWSSENGKQKVGTGVLKHVIGRGTGALKVANIEWIKMAIVMGQRGKMEARNNSPYCSASCLSCEGGAGSFEVYFEPLAVQGRWSLQGCQHRIAQICN